MAQNGSWQNLSYQSTSFVICTTVAQYKSYCANVANSSAIDAVLAESKAYEVLLKAGEAAVGAIHPGNKVSAVYTAAVSVVEREAPELVQNLTKSAGTGIELEFCKSGRGSKDVTLNAETERLIVPYMVFNLSLGFQNLTAAFQNPETEKFSLLLADKVIATKNGPEIHTGLCPKQLRSYIYSSKKNGGEDEAPASKSVVNSDVNQSVTSPLKATIGHENPVSGDANRPCRVSTNEFISYRSPSDLPHSKNLLVQVDEKNEAILLPIYGSMVPFHVSTLESVTSFQDCHTFIITIIFNMPGTTLHPHGTKSLRFEGNTFVKEIHFWTKDWRHGSEVVQQMIALRRQVTSRESVRAEGPVLVSQEKLQLAPGSRMQPMQLPDSLWIRPSFGGRGRKLKGSLEAHTNGFRYTTARPEERVDIIYSNIKHAFFQPAEREVITLLHFHLHSHIMVGNKKTKDVQFFVEVVDAVQTVGGGHRLVLSSDEIVEEQGERERKNKINMEFQTFVDRVNDLWAQPQFKDLDLEFEIPRSELGFHGVAYKASAFIMPTSTCLVELVQVPFLVVTLSEIGNVNLERVGFGQKNFVMAVVFKDSKKDVLQIDGIPLSSLNAILEWLDTTDLMDYKSCLNLRSIRRTIAAEPEKFTEYGGRDFMNVDVSDSQSKGNEESDKVIWTI